MINAFFEDQVNENQNKLVLAVAGYIQSDWFCICAKVATFFYEIVSIELKKAIGIDEFKNQKEMEGEVELGRHNWTSVKACLEAIVLDLNKLDDQVNNSSATGEELLKHKCASEIKIALERQMAKVKFFTDGAENEAKLNKAPITNLGPESNFGSVTEDLKKSGNSTNLSTISDKHIIEKNKLYRKQQWVNFSSDEKAEEWKWAKRSSEVKEVRCKEDDLKKYLDSVSLLAIDGRRKNKLKKKDDLMKALQKCKLHGGPLTAADIDILDTLSEDQVKHEVAYLKLTYGPGIRYKRKVGNKMVDYTVTELRPQIRDVIRLKPDTRY